MSGLRVGKVDLRVESVWTLGAVWNALKKGWAFILVGLIAGGVVGFGLAVTTPPTYQSTATLYVSISQGSSGADLNQGTTYAQNQMQSFAQLVGSSRVLEPVIESLELATTPRSLARSLSVTNPTDTVILRISASSSSAERSAAIANAVARSFADVVGGVSPTASGGAPTITASLVDEAVVPESQSAPNKPQDTALAAAVGFLLGIAVAITRALLDTRVQSAGVLESITDVPVLGTVSTAGKKGLGLAVGDDPLGPTSEEFRRIRSALSYAGVADKVQRVLVTSTFQGEGKSSFSANFSLTLAGLQSRVLLIDGDLRRPRVAEYFGLEGAVGLTTVLLGDVSFEEARISRARSRLDILPSGGLPPNPAELLTSRAMHDFLNEVSRQYDYIIIDSPPVQSVADANLMAPLVDGAVFVIDSRKTRRHPLLAAMAGYQNAGGRIVGVVLNKVKRRRQSDGYYEQAAQAMKDGD